MEVLDTTIINVPIGILSALLVSTFLHDPPGMRQSHPVDWLGIGLLIVGLGALQHVLEEGNRKDWFSEPLIVRLGIAAAICIIVLLRWELSSRHEQPIIEFHVLKNHC